MKHKTKKLLSVATSLAMTMTMCTGFAGVSWGEETAAAGASAQGQAQTEAWDGTSIDTSWYTGHEAASSYEISTPAQLAGLAALVNGYNPVYSTELAAVDFSGKTVSLTGDIDLGGSSASSGSSWHGWTPIGAFKIGDKEIKKAFKGTFDGKGHKVSNLYINITGDSVSNDGYRGLFGQTEDATISNLTLEEVSVTTSTNTAYQRVGALIGNAQSTAISNVQVVSGTIDLTNNAANTGGWYTGGIAGCYSGTMTNCVNKASVKSGSMVGGLIGQTYYTSSAQTGSAIQILRCANYGEVVANDSKTTSTSFAAGGIVGQIARPGDVVKRCVNYGSVSGANQSLGGIAGACGGDKITGQAIESCYNLGSVTGTNDGSYVGGITGYAQKGNTKVLSCYNAGALSGATYCSGIIGVMNSTLDIDKDSICGNYYLANNSYTGTRTSEKDNKFEDDGTRFASFVTADAANLYNSLGKAYGPYVADLEGCEANAADSYPVLRWQNPNSTYETSFSFTYDDQSHKTAEPVVTVTSKTAPSTPCTADDQGKFNLTCGTYSYTVTCEGFNNASGEFAIEQDDKIIEVSLTTKTDGDDSSDDSDKDSSAAAELAKAKADAKAALQAAVDGSGLIDADKSTLQETANTYIAKVDAATTKDEVASVLSAGKDAIQVKADELALARAKADAKAQLSELLANAAISEEAKADARDIMTEYVVKIDAATNASEISELYAAGRTEIEAYIDFAKGTAMSLTVNNMSYKLVYKTKTATLVKLAGKAKTAKSIKVPATVSYLGYAYKVTGIGSKACAKQTYATKMTLGKNVKSAKAKAIHGCKKLTTVIVNGKKLTKASVRNLVKSTKVKVIKVKISKESVNKKFAAKYGKWAKRFNSKVKVRAAKA